MEVFLHHSKTSTTVQPTKSGFPPCGLVRVAPQTEHEITLSALEKIVVSLPQSLQDTFRNELAIILHLSCQQVRISLLFGMVHSEPFQSQCICIGYLLSWWVFLYHQALVSGNHDNLSLPFGISFDPIEVRLQASFLHALLCVVCVCLQMGCNALLDVVSLPL